MAVGIGEIGERSVARRLGGDADVVVVVVAVVEGLSRERDLARGVRCVIRWCCGGRAVGGRVSGGIGVERKLVVAHGGNRAAGSIL